MLMYKGGAKQTWSVDLLKTPTYVFVRGVGGESIPDY